MDFGKIKELTYLAKGAYLQAKKEKGLLEENKVKLNNKLQAIEKAQLFLQGVAQVTQENLKIQVEDIVNLALDTCFPDEYLFSIDFDISRGKTEASLKFTDKRTGREVDPMNASGGGVVDLTSFALRVACYVLERNSDNVIILDEPFRFLSRDLQARAGTILKELSNKMGIQIIMVTHIGEIIDVADRLFEVSKNKNGVSAVKTLI